VTAATEHLIIGTAGHIDHGKTALVKALTGIDADTLAEEKKRGITIELGFVFLNSPEDSKQIVFIDVPGHEKLVRTMVAGASNIDAALLVIAADEGISNQTREHLDVLSLLDINTGIVALTKSDLVDDAELAKVTREVRDFIAGTFLENAPLLPVSAVTGAGIKELETALRDMAEKIPTRQDRGIFRMPVDRVFTMQGFGTVIAGTVLSGTVQAEDKVMVYPEKLSTRVRGVQVHHAKTAISAIGNRTAINLADLKKNELYRGQCIAEPDSLIPTNRIDATLRLLTGNRKELKNRARARFHTGTSEVICRIILLDRDKLMPGDAAPVQYVLEAQAVALPGDRYVVRSFSPIRTLGGGTILDIQPPKHKRMNPVTAAALQQLQGDLASCLAQLLRNSRYQPLREAALVIRSGQSLAAVRSTLATMTKNNEVVKFGLDYLHSDYVVMLKERVMMIVTEYFSRNRYQETMPRAEINSQLANLADSSVINPIVEMLVAAKALTISNNGVMLAASPAGVSDVEEETLAAIVGAFKAGGYSPPLPSEVGENLKLSADRYDDLYRLLCKRQTLVRISDKVTYHSDVLAELQKKICELAEQNNGITVSEYRNAAGISRKYALALLEYLDNIGVTIRIDDRHVLRKKV